jgi:hypothetical protein
MQLILCNSCFKKKKNVNVFDKIIHKTNKSISIEKIIKGLYLTKFIKKYLGKSFDHILMLNKIDLNMDNQNKETLAKNKLSKSIVNSVCSPLNCNNIKILGKVDDYSNGNLAQIQPIQPRRKQTEEIELKL